MTSISKQLIILTLLITTLRLLGQYSNPVKHAITLAGSFGELRSSHFHAGIDIRPSANGRETDTIYAVGDGYISRIKVQRGGFGRAVYIDHPGGQTSVYAHMSQVLEPIGSTLLSEQKRRERYEVDMYPKTGSIRVYKGQPIGILGNAGSSYGAHLHFEMRDTKSEVTLNPFAFGIKAKDNIPPTLSSIGIHSLGLDFYDVAYRLVNPSEFNVISYSPISIKGWRIGIGVQGYDQMLGASNKNGIYEYKLFVDDTLYFHTVMDEVDYDKGELIDAFIDYPLKKETRRTEALLYRLPTNTFPAVKYAKGDGLINIYAQTPRKICVELKDFDGNTTSKCLMVIRDTGVMADNYGLPFDHYARATEASSFTKGQVSIEIPANCFARDQYITVDRLSNGCYKIGNENEAVLKSLNVCLTIDDPSTIDNKTILASSNSNGSYNSKGGTLTRNQFCSKISSFGTYCLYRDVAAPRLNFTTKGTTVRKGTTIVAAINDNVNYKSPAHSHSYKVTIDDEFVPAEYKEIVDRIYIKTDNLSLGKHTVVISSTDFKGNTSTTTKDFNIR